MTDYLRPSVSNGIAAEQALIRRWWHEENHARGQLVWEYYIEGRYADAVLFPSERGSGVEHDGQESARRFPLEGAAVILCEAKRELTPELVGQALVYSVFAERAGANVTSTIIFAETGSDSMREAAKDLGLFVVIGSSTMEPPNKAIQRTAFGRR